MALSQEDIDALKNPVSFQRPGIGGVRGLSDEDRAVLGAGVSRPAPRTVFVPAIKRGTGEYLQNVEETARRLGVGVEGLKTYGQQLVEENPQVTPATVEGFLERPGTFIAERTGEQLANLGTSIGGTALGAVAGGAIAGPPGAAAGALVGGAAAIAPSTFGEVGRAQRVAGIDDTQRLLEAGAFNTLIELGGIQAAGRKIITGAAELGAKEVAKRLVAEGATAPTLRKTLTGTIGKTLKIAAGEAAEEIPQNEAQRYAVHKDILTQESVREDLNNFVSAFAGSLLVGGAGGAVQQTQQNKAIAEEITRKEGIEAFKRNPPGYQATIPGTNLKQAQEYDKWATDNTDTVGDRRAAKYGVGMVLPKESTFSDVNKAVELLESGVPVEGLRATPKIAALDKQIAAISEKGTAKQEKIIANLAKQKTVFDTATAALAAEPDNAAAKKQLEKATKKLESLQKRVDAPPPATLAKLTAERDALSAALTPLDLTKDDARTKAQDKNRVKLLDKLHTVRGEMAYYMDKKVNATEAARPDIGDQVSRDMLDELADLDAAKEEATRNADFARARAQQVAEVSPRAAEFEAARAEVEARKAEDLDAIQREAAPRVTEAGPPLEGALQQALRAVPETITPEAAPAVVADNKMRLQAVYQEKGKTQKEAAALVRTLTKNTDVNNAEAVGALIREKADNPKTQTSIDTLDALHKAVTGVSLDEFAQGEQNAAQARQIETSNILQRQGVSPLGIAAETGSRGGIPEVTRGRAQPAQTQEEVTAQSLAEKFSSVSPEIVKINEQIVKLEAKQEDTPTDARAQTLDTLYRRKQSIEDAAAGLTVAAPKYSSGQTAAVKGVQASDANTIVTRVKRAWKNAPQFRVVQSVTDLTQAEQQELTANGQQKARGFYRAGEVVIIADNNESSQRIVATVFHESLGHFGLASRFGTELNALLRTIYDTNAEMRKAADAFIAKNPAASKELAVEEVLAKASEPGKLYQSVFGKIVAFIRDFARKHLKLNIAISNNDVTAILRQAHEAVTEGGAAAPVTEAQQRRFSLPEDVFEDTPYVKANTDVGREIDNFVRRNPTLWNMLGRFLNFGVEGTVSTSKTSVSHFLESQFQSPLHLASKSQGYAKTWQIMRQSPAVQGYILNEAFKHLENTWVKGAKITAARTQQFLTGVENATFQDLKRAEIFLNDWNTSGLTLDEYLQEPSTIEQFGDNAAGQGWFARVTEARKAIDTVLDAQFLQNAEDMREVIEDDAVFTEWLDNAVKAKDGRMKTGYIPIRRFGNYSVGMYDMSRRDSKNFPTGDQGLMGRWFFESEAQAREVSAELKTLFPDDPDIKLDSDFTQGKPQFISKEAASQYSYAPVSFRQFFELAKRANVPITAAEQRRLAQLMISADSMFQNRIQLRKNIPGGSKDLVRSMSEFITFIADRVAADRLAPRVSEAMNNTRPLATEDIILRDTLRTEFAWADGMSEQQIRDAIKEQTVDAGGTMVEQITQLARLNKLKTLESNGFMTWRTSVNTNDPAAVAEYEDLISRSEFLDETEVERLTQISAPDPQTGFYHDKISELSEYVRNPKSEAFSNFRRFAAVNFLGGSIASMVVNFSSLPLNFMPYMHQYAGWGAYSTTMHWFKYSMGSPFMRGIIFNNDVSTLEAALAPDGKLPDGLSRDQAAALLRAFREEVVADTQVFEYFAASKHGVQVGTVLGQRAQALWMSPFRISEMTNRVTSFLSAYEIAEKNKIEGRQLGAEEKYQFARNAVDQTQFIYGPVNRMGFAQNPVGFALMTFRAFPIMTIELLSRLPPKQRTIMLGTMLMASGLGGIPFKDDILDILDMIGQKVFGVPLNSNRVLHNYLKQASEAAFGMDASRLLMTGPLDVLTGASIGSRVSTSNMIPATRIGTAGYTLAQGAEDLGGVIAAETKGVLTGVGHLFKGNISEAVSAASPTAIKGVARFTEGVNSNRLTDKNGNLLADELTMGELTLLGAGFTLSRSNYAFTRNMSAQQERAFVTETTRSMFNNMADAYQKNDYAAIADAAEAIQDWNEQYPQYHYEITPARLRKELLTRNLTPGQREFQKINKAWRGEFEELLEEEE